MVAPVKITRALSLMLIRDLPRYISMAEAAGIPAPTLSLQYHDGLTRADAVALQQWGGRIPAVRAALADLSHPDHAAVLAFAGLTQHFSAVHPQTDAGEPAAWNEPLSVGMRVVSPARIFRASCCRPAKHRPCSPTMRREPIWWRRTGINPTRATSASWPRSPH
jgi:hypothetical protein